MTKQRNQRVSYACEGVRGEAVYAFRKMLVSKGIKLGKDIDEGEYLSQLLEEAVVKAFGGAGEGSLRVYRHNYFESLEKK